MTLAELRAHHGLTQVEFANRIGVSQPSFQGWESGKSAMGVKTALRIIEAFDVVATLRLDEKTFIFTPREQWEASRTVTAAPAAPPPR